MGVPTAIRHIYGKWAYRCCQVLLQLPSVAEVIEGGIAASGFVAHTLISLDYMPYSRQETVNARSGVHTPRSTPASIAGQAGARGAPAPHRRQSSLGQRLHARTGRQAQQARQRRQLGV